MRENILDDQTQVPRERKSKIGPLNWQEVEGQDTEKLDGGEK